MDQVSRNLIILVANVGGWRYNITMKQYHKKRCQICGKFWQPTNRYQAKRNKTCGPVCNAQRISLSKRGKRLLPPIICPQCGKKFYPKWGAVSKAIYCSRHCNGIERAKNLVHYSANGKGKKRPGKGLTGEKNPAWKGGVTYFRKHGNYKPIKYVRCPLEFKTMARKDGYVMEHRLLMAMAIGRPLLRQEAVHHRNHNPQDNRLENLELFASNRAHKIAESVRRAAACSIELATARP
jgi:hypothetical protein